MKCRVARSADIADMTRIISQGFHSYPLHGMVAHYMRRDGDYMRFLDALNEMMVRAYMRWHTALVVEERGDVIAVALLHQKKPSLFQYVLSGGSNVFRYGTPATVVAFFNATNDADKEAEENATFDWYLEVLLVKEGKRGKGVGRWLVAEVLPDYISQRGGTNYGFVTATAYNAQFYENSGCELLGTRRVYLREQSCPIWAFEKKVNEGAGKKES